jgi:acetyl-CoA synthetase
VSEATEIYRSVRDQLIGLRGQQVLACQTFRWPGFGETFNWAVDWFDAIARGNDRPALVVVQPDGSAVTRSFDEMAVRSDQVAAWLAAHGVGRGDPVIVMLNNQVELWESMLAVMKLGAIIMPTTTAAGPTEIQDRLTRGAARHAICNAGDTMKFADTAFADTALAGADGSFGRFAVGQAEGWADMNEAFCAPAAVTPHPGTAPYDPLLLYFTSGTTSQPKLVQHTQVSYPVGHLSTMYWIGLRPGDVHLNISSPGWAKHAWSCFFAPWIAEATNVVYNYTRFDPAALLEQLRSRQVTTFCAPPTVWRMMINADLSAGPGSLREVVAAGEPLNPEVIEQVRRQWGLVIRDGFGQTETTAQVGNAPEEIVKPGSMGRPLPGVPVVLVDPLSGRPVDGTGEGEICLDLESRPVPLMTGYLQDPVRDAEAMAGGFYHTGDIASRDDDGYLTYIGRTDDVFKASDYKISPFELESVLIEHPAVAEAAIVPAPDPIRLAVPKAYVALVAGYEPNEETALAILSYARERLAPYQRVRRLEFFELPKTISGKIRRVELRGREADLARNGRAAELEFRDDKLRDQPS